MARTCLSLLLTLATLSVLANDSRIIAQSPGSISFVVDENLKPVDYEFALTNGGEIARLCMRPPMDKILDEAEKNNSLVASSFANENNLEYQGEGPFNLRLLGKEANQIPQEIQVKHFLSEACVFFAGVLISGDFLYTFARCS